MPEKNQNESGDPKSFLNTLKWALLKNSGRQGFTAIFSFVLAAILGPEAFGIIAIAYVYISFVELFLNQGMNSTIIQRKELHPDHINSAFWFMLVLSFILCLLSLVFCGWWADTNETPILAQIIAYLSLLLPIQGLSFIQRTLLRREKDFKSLAFQNLLSVIIGGVVGVTTAFMGWGVWALVAQQLSLAVSGSILLWYYSKWRPQLRFSFPHLKDLYKFSISVYASTMGDYLRLQSDALIMGIFFGPLAVGLYRFADRVNQLASRIFTSSVHEISLSHLAELQDEPVKLKEKFLDCVKISTLYTFPVMAILACCAHPLLSILSMFGEDWMPACSVLQLLCIYGMLWSINLLIGPLLIASNRPGVFAGIVWVNGIVNALAFVGAGMLYQNSDVKGQIMAIAVTRISAFLLFYVTLSLYLSMRICGIKIPELLTSIRVPIIEVIGIGLIYLVLWATGVLGYFGPIPELVILSLSLGTCSVILLYTFEENVQRVVLKIFGMIRGKILPVKKSGVEHNII